MLPVSVRTHEQLGLLLGSPNPSRPMRIIPNTAKAASNHVRRSPLSATAAEPFQALQSSISIITLNPRDDYDPSHR